MRDYELLAQIGKRIRSRRESLGLTREQLAERVEVSTNFCAEIELGTKGMSPQNLLKMAKALYVSPNYILLGSTEESSHEVDSLTNLIKTCNPDKLKFLEGIVQNFVQATEPASHE